MKQPFQVHHSQTRTSPPSLYLTEEYLSLILNHKSLNPILSLISAHISHFLSATVPNILSLPRELRDEIYKWAFLDTLALPKTAAPSTIANEFLALPSSFLGT